MKIRLIIFSLLLLSLFACDNESTSPGNDLQSPTNFSLEQLEWNSISLSWQDNSSDESHYRIDRKIGDSEWEEKYVILDENVTAFTDANLTTIANYRYRIYAFNADEISDFTEGFYSFSYDEVGVINLINSEELILYPLESKVLQYALKTSNGQLVTHDCEIWFKIISAPEGTNINNTLYNSSDSIYVESMEGVVSITLNAGSEEGEVILKAYSFNSNNEETSLQTIATVDLQLPEVSEINFLNSGNIFLHPLESSEISVQLVDEYGSIVLEEYDVMFQFIGMPDGTNLNNVLFESADVLTVGSTDGAVSVTLNAGEVVGNVELKVFTHNSLGEEISVTKSNILIQPYQPDSILFSYDGISEGENIGGGLWRIDISALIIDIYGNPCANGTIVNFSLIDSPGFAVIETEMTTINPWGQHPGVAKTFLSYDGAHSNEEIAVQIEVEDVITDETIILPLQFPVIDMIAVPNHFEWTVDENPEYKDIEIRCVVLDGQSNRINGQLLYFETTAGWPQEPDPADTGDPYTGITGPGLPPFEDENGMLFKYVRLYKEEFPAPAPAPFPVNVQINVSILGTDVETTETITITRYLY